MLRGAQWLPLALMVATVFGGLAARAARWQAYFRPERRVRFGPALGTLAISYMASTFLPFRAGELVRAVFLGRREAIPVPRVVGTILLEKLFDFLGVGVILVILLVTTPLPGWATATGSTLAAVILGGFGFVVALAVWRGPTLRLLGEIERRLPLRLGRRLPLARLAAQFATGTDSLRVAGLWVPMLGWTAVAWVFGLAQTWLGAQSVGLWLGFPEVALVLVLTSMGQAVPSSPGYVGVYHAAAVGALKVFGVDDATALGAAVLTHAFSYGSLVVAGLAALWLGGYALADLGVGLRAPADAPAPEPTGPPESPTPEMPAAATGARRRFDP